jgi:hypothetical protein
MQGTPQFYGFKNRIINGAMVIDQRNNGAAIASLGTFTYTVDRFYVQCDSSGRFSFQQNQGSVTPPSGFINYAGFTSLGANAPSASQFNVLAQGIEGLNATDLGWGTANASTVTLSFWVRSSVTGSLGGALVNGSSNRSYSFLYTINSANTWEYKTITIAGDTTGTWATNNTVFTLIRWSLGAGSSLITTPNQWNASNSNGATGQTNISATSGATFYITGVQLEVGVTATSFDFRSIGQELALAQRYYLKWTAGQFQRYALAYADTTTNVNIITNTPVTMRATPASSLTNMTANGNSIPTSGVSAFSGNTCYITATTSGVSAGEMYQIYSASGTTGVVELSSEL